MIFKILISYHPYDKIKQAYFSLDFSPLGIVYHLYKTHNHLKRPQTSINDFTSPLIWNPNRSWPPVVISECGVCHTTADIHIVLGKIIRKKSYYWMNIANIIFYYYRCPQFTARLPNGISRINLVCPTGWAFVTTATTRNQAERPVPEQLTHSNIPYLRTL